MHWPDSFQANRRIRMVNLLLQAVLFMTLFAGVNYLALQHSWRFDLTRNRIFSLSRETVSYIERIEQPVEAIVAFDTSQDDPDVQQARRDVVALLREYTRIRHGSAPVISLREIDVFQSPRIAAQLGVSGTNVIVFTSGDQTPRTVKYEELYRVENQQRVEFLGESRFTAAILDLTSAVKEKIYFLTGHGELDPTLPDERTGLSSFHHELRSRNFALEQLDLRQSRKIPEDAALVISIAPTQTFLEEEQELLRQYLNNDAGRFLLAVNPPMERELSTGLESLLADWGLDLPDCLVVEPDPAKHLAGGDLMFGRYDPRHPIVGPLRETSSWLVTSRARPVQLSSVRPNNAALDITQLVQSSTSGQPATSGYGERSFRYRTAFDYDPGIDLPGPVCVAAVSQGVSVAGALPFSIRSGRLIVFGTSEFFTNQRFGLLGNSQLAVSAVNWALDRSSKVNAPPRPLHKFQLSLSEPNLMKLRLALVLVVPGAVALFGLIIHWSRRS